MQGFAGVEEIEDRTKGREEKKENKTLLLLLRCICTSVPFISFFSFLFFS